VAAALMDGQVGLEQFTPERIKDPKVHQLSARVKIVADEEMEGMRPANRPAIVEITLKSGQTFTGRVDYPKGDPRKPMTDEELLKKFDCLASNVLSEEKVRSIRTTVFDLENTGDVSKLMELCF
jgi:2-methylcitrate dehydratase